MPGKRKQADPTPYKVLTFKGSQPAPTILRYTDPLVALTVAVEYLKAGHQVRLSDGCVEWFGHQPALDPDARAAALMNGQAAAFTGPPEIGEMT
jgi:hypothetical protein